MKIRSSLLYDGCQPFVAQSLRYREESSIRGFRQATRELHL